MQIICSCKKLFMKKQEKTTTIPTLKWFGRRISEPSSWKSKGTPPTPPRLQEGLVRGWLRDNVYKPWKSRPHWLVEVWQWGTLRFPRSRPIEAAIPPPSISASRHSPASWYQCQTFQVLLTGDLDDLQNPKNIHIPIGSMGRLCIFSTWMLDFYGKVAGKYTIAYVDGMGYKSRFYINLNDILIIPSSWQDSVLQLIYSFQTVLCIQFHYPIWRISESSLSHDKGPEILARNLSRAMPEMLIFDMASWQQTSVGDNHSATTSCVTTTQRVHIINNVFHK